MSGFIPVYLNKRYIRVPSEDSVDICINSLENFLDFLSVTVSSRLNQFLVNITSCMGFEQLL